MKDLENTNYVLGIQILRIRKNKLLGLYQASCIDKMQNSKKGLLPTRHGVEAVSADTAIRRGHETDSICICS